MTRLILVFAITVANTGQVLSIGLTTLHRNGRLPVWYYLLCIVGLIIHAMLWKACWPTEEGA